jgi:putative spermidine/putrescine transport system ATP-binding protein
MKCAQEVAAMAKRDRAAEIRAAGIGKSYGNFQALSDVSLTIGRGEFLTVLGPSGSGKTTFLMILAGFETATSGQLLQDGVDITALPAEDRSFGMVFQGYALFPHMTVEQNIAFPLKVQHRSAKDIKRAVNEMIDRVGLRGHEQKRPVKLSGGQQQRVALARALVFEPAILLLDEPFSALDKNLRVSMREEVRRLHQETGTTFVFVTHDQAEALALSTHVAIFENGRLQQIGDPKEVYEQPTTRFVAEFLGDVNILPLSGVSATAEGAEGQFEGRSVRIIRAVDTVTGKLAIRPEHMVLSTMPPAEGNALQATIETITYLGAETRFSLKTPGGVPLILQMPTRETGPAFECRNMVWARWPANQGFFL